MMTYGSWFKLHFGLGGIALAACVGAAVAQPVRPLNPVHKAYPSPAAETEPRQTEADDDLAQVIDQAYRTNPGLAARRYDLRATDDALGIARSEVRPVVQAQISGGYDYTRPGSITQASRPLSDRLNDPNIERNDIAAQLVVDQPILTGGRARADERAAKADIFAGRQELRSAEGDLLLDVITAYVGVRRDDRVLNIRRANVRGLKATLDEVIARREAGELTWTDIAQAETQLQAADVQLNAAEAQLETSRTAFTTLVGRPPRKLAREPLLPLLPPNIDDAFDTAGKFNSDIAAAVAAERASHARISVAQSQGNPTLSVRGSASTAGPALPYDRRDQDVTLAARLTLTVPIFAGGRINAQTNQARNRNSADMLRIEATRRQVVQAIVNSWNQSVAADRNEKAQENQLKAARIFFEGTTEEYREGLRSTFDVLYAQNSLRDTEIALLDSQRDRYIAQATLLRYIGQLEASKLITRSGLYDPTRYTSKVMRRDALPWDGVVRAVDASEVPPARRRSIEPVQAGPEVPHMAPGIDLPSVAPLVTNSPVENSGAVLAVDTKRIPE